MTGVVVGVDPGVSGGVAFILGTGVASAYSMPVLKIGSKSEINITALVRLISNVRELYGPVRLAAVEKVSARPGQGVCSMFSFGVGYGAVRAVLEVLEVPYEMPTPQRWQKEIFAGMAPAKDTKLSSVAYCTRRFPGVSLRATDRCRKAHDGMADALCLAEWARRMVTGGTGQ